jgi:hypothetical protein
MKPLIVICIVAGFVLRYTLPKTKGVTLYLPSQARYIPANILAFWLSLAIAVGLLLIILLKKA